MTDRGHQIMDLFMGGQHRDLVFPGVHLTVKLRNDSSFDQEIMRSAHSHDRSGDISPGILQRGSVTNEGNRLVCDGYFCQSRESLFQGYRHLLMTNLLAQCRRHRERDFGAIHLHGTAIMKPVDSCLITTPSVVLNSAAY